jgi:hypothetical protein
MSDDEPIVNVKYSVYHKLREDLREMQNRIYVLEKALETAKLNDASGATQLLHGAFLEAVKIVQFAVGNLAPETVAGWPHKALAAIADAIEKIPAIDPHVAELPSELRHFARLAAGYEEYRKQRDANRVVTMATGADFGPQTADAAAAHAARIGSAPSPSPSTESVTVQLPATDRAPT